MLWLPHPTFRHINYEYEGIFLFKMGTDGPYANSTAVSCERWSRSNVNLTFESQWKAVLRTVMHELLSIYFFLYDSQHVRLTVHESASKQVLNMRVCEVKFAEDGTKTLLYAWLNLSACMFVYSCICVRVCVCVYPPVFPLLSSEQWDVLSLRDCTRQQGVSRVFLCFTCQIAFPPLS